MRAEYRTLVGPFERCIVVDDRVAFISNYLVEQAPAHAAWQITCRATVAYIGPSLSRSGVGLIVVWGVAAEEWRG
ncbi:hypothetical protein D3C59_36625 [Streptomyces sp. SHP22-7]|nr:hypothetical protein D3C59_36625 [Streptomyces sp. SHP22-7]